MMSGKESRISKMKEDVERRSKTTGAQRGGRERNSQETRCGASNISARIGNSAQEEMQLMEAVVGRKNMIEAYNRVVGNKGAPGVDEMTVYDLKPYLQKEWSRIKEELLAGRYTPLPVRRVDIPKASGKGTRMLGIPCVIDRLIQQALNQILQPLYDPGFSPHSYGFRPERKPHQAVLQAKTYVSEGRRWVVDMDLEKFFDRVNHDVLMARLARKIKDKRVLKLIRAYLQAGMLEGGLVSQRVQGTPQGGPLSPLLSNILLDELDKELEKRGHAFCRYADDCNIYVRSKRAGERVLASITRFVETRLRLKVNAEKSAVDRPWKRKFLGYSLTWHKEPRIKVARESIDRCKAKLRMLFRQGRGQNLKKFIESLRFKLMGWVAYFKLAEVRSIFEEMDGWIRRKLRMIRWRQWKHPRTRAKNLIKRGLKEDRAWKSAYNGRGPWWNAGAPHMHAAFPNKYFEKLGLVSLLQRLHRLQAAT